VVVNVPKSQGYGFFNAFVDYDFSKVWIFGTPNDRCQCGNSCGSPAHMNHTCGSEPSGICYGNAWVQTWSSTDLLTWETALAGGTKGVAVPNMDVARVRTTPEEQAALGLPPHRYIMILETAQSCCGQPEFKETVFMINNEASGDLTTGWMPTEFVITNQSHRSVGCPSIRVGTDGYYYAVTGMGACERDAPTFLLLPRTKHSTPRYACACPSRLSFRRHRHRSIAQPGELDVRRGHVQQLVQHDGGLLRWDGEALTGRRKDQPTQPVAYCQPAR
jgi:hypothetical protein